MELRFKRILLSLFLLFYAASNAFADSSVEKTQNSKALKMIAERMRSLTQSLENMPEPPSFNQKINLPEIPATASESNHSTDLSKEEEL